MSYAMTDLVNDYFKRFYPSLDQLYAVDPRMIGMGCIERRVDGFSNIFPAIVCADGLTLSVQGHCGAYSYPRDDWAEEYGQVEIMGPPKADELLAPFERECNACGDEMIYPYVPVEIVAAVIEKHGGLKFDDIKL